MKIRKNNNLLTYLITNTKLSCAKEILKFNRYYKDHKSFKRFCPYTNSLESLLDYP